MNFYSSLKVAKLSLIIKTFRNLTSENNNMLPALEKGVLSQKFICG